MADTIWLRAEPRPFADVEILTEGAREVAFTRAGVKTTVPASEVRALRHGDTPAELDHALRRMEKADFRAAEKLLAPFESREDWVRAHAGFHRTNARRLRAELEDAGHDEALAGLKAWREREGEHYLAPLVAIVSGDAALAAKDLDLARAQFTRLATYGGEAALGSRLGLARVALASRTDVAAAIAELEAVEKDALAARPANADLALFARITRAAALGKTHAKQGLELLIPLLDTPGMVRSPWQGAALNAIAELVADLAGRLPDGSARPFARVAAQPFINRALRYTSAQPVERARTLALAVEANTLSGRLDVALMAKTELGRRFATSTYAR
jgi:hypothetical protein